MSYNFAPVVFLATFLWHWRQLLVLSQFVPQCLEGSSALVLRLEVDDLCCPTTRILHLAIVRLWVKLTENIVDFAARSLHWVRRGISDKHKEVVRTTEWEHFIFYLTRP